MATTYTITVQTLEGGIGPWSDTVSSLRDELDSVEKNEEFALGERIGTRKADDWGVFGGTRYYYYHNGRITVRTHYNQLTLSQRTGARGYNNTQAVRDFLRGDR